MKQHIYKNLATQGAIGYMSAPGTMATIMVIPFVYLLGTYNLAIAVYLSMALTMLLLGWIVVRKALPFFDEKDPSTIVLDEMIGFIFVFIGIPCTVQTILLGFIAFRLLDIYKLFGVSYLERLDGAYGIMLDDVGAALIANLFLHSLYYLHWM